MPGGWSDRACGRRRGSAVPDARALCASSATARKSTASARSRRRGSSTPARWSASRSALPFEPVNRPRLEMLKVERATARAHTLATHRPVAKFADRRRQAQIAARHALQRIAAGARDRIERRRADREREMAAAIHAAELQLPGIVAAVRRLAIDTHAILSSTQRWYCRTGIDIDADHRRDQISSARFAT